MALPLVSIVIPCFNAGAMVERCVRSCLAQTHPRLEIIVVDNNCTDDTIARVGRLARDASHPITVTQCTIQGVTHARNAGIDLASGDYLQLLDADDELAVEKIACQAASLERHGEFDIAYGDWTWCLKRDTGKALRVGLRSSQFDDYLLQLLVDNWRPPHAYLLRRAAFGPESSLPHFFTDTRYADDREYFTAAALLGLRFLYVANAPVLYNSWSSTQMTRSIPAQVRVDSLEHIFRRLRGIAERAPQHRLGDLHRQLLEQSWKCWQMSASRRGEQGISVGAALCASVLRRTGMCDTLEHHARVVARVLCLETAARMARGGATVSLDKVQRAMDARLDGEAPQAHRDGGGRSSGIPDQSIVSCNVAIGELMAHGPMYLPIFAQQRVQIMRHLDELCRAGLLQCAGSASTVRRE